MTTRAERRMEAPPSTYVAMLITGALAAAALGGATVTESTPGILTIGF